MKKGERCFMKDKNKLFGLIGLCASAIVTTLVTQWMTEKEIKSRVDEALAEKEIEKLEQES